MADSITRVRSEIEKFVVNDEYCIEDGVITAKASKALTGYDIQGCFLVGNTVAAAGDEASITGVVLFPGIEKLTLATTASTTKKYPILRRGPAILDKAGLPTADPVGGAYTMATIITRLLALGIKVVSDDSLSQSAPL